MGYARRSWIAILLVAVLGLSSACSALAPASPTAVPRPTPQPAATLAPSGSPSIAPKSGGVVTVYSALSESMNGAIRTAFEKAQPVISLDIRTLAAAGDLEALVRDEMSAPKADVLLGGSSEYHESLGKAGFLESYKPVGAASVDSSLKAPDGYWAGWYLGILGIVVNTELWDRQMQGKPRPSLWDDLVSPELAGKIAMPDPITTGAGYIFLANQVFRFGRDETKAMDYMKKLNANVGKYTSTAPLAIDEVGKGSLPLGVNWGHDVLTAAGNGLPLTFVAPEDTAFEVGGVSIVKGGPNPTGAKAFVDWIMSREAAEVVVRTSNRISVLPRVSPAPGAPTLESVKLVDYDRSWATYNKERLLAAWRSTVGR